MATIYTKTSLKKIKKDELIQMFLDQQAKLNDIQMDLDGDGWFLKLKENEKIKEENVMLDSLSEKLINENEDFKEENVILNSLNEKHNRLNEILKEGNKKLKAENEKLKGKLQEIKDHYDLGHLADEWQMNDDFSITL